MAPRARSRRTARGASLVIALVAMPATAAATTCPPGGECGPNPVLVLLLGPPVLAPGLLLALLALGVVALQRGHGAEWWLRGVGVGLAGMVGALVALGALALSSRWLAAHEVTMALAATLVEALPVAVFARSARGHGGAARGVWRWLQGLAVAVLAAVLGLLTGVLVSLSLPSSRFVPVVSGAVVLAEVTLLGVYAKLAR